MAPAGAQLGEVWRTGIRNGRGNIFLKTRKDVSLRMSLILFTLQQEREKQKFSNCHLKYMVESREVWGLLSTERGGGTMVPLTSVQWPAVAAERMLRACPHFGDQNVLI